ncbi:MULTISPECIES: DUF1493 family protein [Pseudomonas]|uniref:DUF1493 family protein n=1 Tax=Pseudomonas azadiae TaxID=2843612 RepID=A0ABS6P015_9PSED|nr:MULTISPECIES: DUF1493 family protein [Pseudomonas]MBV4453802.1 DUF1493 family protein [Pseudomonas azadiae]NMF44101.1 DUF1493 family protein [Pseudomonas sp. SWRI 103]
MIEYLQWIIFIVLNFALDNKVKSQNVRKYLGLSTLAGGLICAIWLPYWINEIKLPSLPIGAILIGSGLYFDRNRHNRVRSTHPLLIAPTLNLAPYFPDDPVMLHLLQLLHENVGLPKHSTVTLNTSINHDLGCSSVEAKQLITALRQDLGMKLGDYQNGRYFKRPGFDAYLHYVDRGSEGKTPLTIGMLYQAIKAKRWDTLALEAKRCQKP